MAESSQPPEESNVCVAVKLRPLVAYELDDGCQQSLFVTPGCPQVTTRGQHTFTYDHVFGADGTAPEQLYPRCIAPLVDGLFKGYNATVFAYGQTGSGKTFTMGSEYRPGARCRGVIPDTINDIFNRIDAAKDRAVTVRVSFVEIHKEEIKDLLLPASNGPRPAVTIRETQNGDVALYGAVEKEVRSREEMAEVLELGTLCRSTASTNMNNRSSRSHAIFTVTLEQRRQVQQAAVQPEQVVDDDGEDDDDNPREEVEGVEDFLGAKMHLVDLAGSERAKKTKAEGARLREGIHINRGLLALGNVINAIVDNHKHVPYRDSKLTRLLQDSLGGNSRTVMIACVSPADSNFEESLNTLRYADRARHIRNKPVVNRDPVAAQLAVLRNTIAQLKSENMSLRRALGADGSEGAVDALGTSGLGNSALEGLVERLTQENSALESENMRLKMDMDDLRRELAAVADKWHTAQAQCDLLKMNQAAAAGRRDSVGGPDGGELPLPGLDIVKGYVARIAELEAEVMSMKALAAHMPFSRRRPNGMEHPRTPGGLSASEDLYPTSPGPSAMSDVAHGAADDGVADEDSSLHPHPELAELAGEEDYFIAELAAHTLNQEKMKKEVALLQRQLEAKERKMVELMKNTGSMPALKQHYDRVLADLETQRDTLISERKALMEKLAAVSAQNEEERKRLESQYGERIQQYDERLKELRRKEREFIAMQKLKQRTEDAHRRLHSDIVRIKQAKVTLQKQLEANAKQFAAWKHEREREMGQLRKQSRKDRAQIQQLQAMTAKQSAVLQRKISDATAARKRIKELEEEKRRKTASVSSIASQQQVAAALAAQQANGGVMEIQPNAQAPLLRTDQERRAWLERELQLCDMAGEFKKVLEGELAQRAEATLKLKELEKRLTYLDQTQPASPLFAGAALPVSPATTPAMGASGPAGMYSLETREKLLARKKELEDKVAYHNDEITKLQQDWERQKSDEESRGGGVHDVRRWAGLRNVAECRELLRILFRISVESKTLSNDLTYEAVRYQEEAEVLRVQLDGAQKKCAQYRKLAMAMQAAAARVAAAPQHNTVSTQDETDKQVDAVLEELFVVRGNTPPAASGPSRTNGSTGGGPTAGTSGGRLGTGSSEAQADDIEMEDAGVQCSPDVSKDGATRALSFLTPVPKKGRVRFATPGGTASRYAAPKPEQDGYDSDDQVVHRGSEGGQARSAAGGRCRVDARADDGSCAMDVDDEAETETERLSSADRDEEALVSDSGTSGDGSDKDDDSDEEDEESSDGGDSDEDVEWDPDHATPARGRKSRVSRRFSTAVGAGCCGGGSGRNSRRQSAAESSASDQDQPSDSNVLRGKGGGSRRASSSRRNSSTADDVTVSLEGPVLDDINLKRLANQQTRIQKLTVAALRDALKNQEIDGVKWRATIRDEGREKNREKNRAELIQDYRRMLGLDKLQSRPQSASHSPDADVKRDDVGARRSGKAGSSGTEVSVGGAKPVALPQAGPSAKATAEDEGFTFSPHLPAAPVLAVSGPPVVPPLAMNFRSPSPSKATSARRLALASPGGQGPWARASSAQTNSARQPSSWESSLRSSCTLPAANAGGEMGSAESGPVLLRANSGSNSGSRSSQGAVNAAPQAAIAADVGGGGAGAASSRRPTAAWAPPARGHGVGGGAPLSYRAALASPSQNPSPRALRPPIPAGASPRSSMGSPTPRSVPRSGGRTGRAFSPGMSPDVRDRDFGYNGGENMQPDGDMTPQATLDKPSTPLTNMYKEKAAAARERSTALRASMQRNWQQQDQRSSGGLSGSANLRSSLNGPVGTTGAVTSSMEGPLRGGSNLRDSIGAGLGALKNQQQQQKQIWR